LAGAFVQDDEFLTMLGEPFRLIQDAAIGMSRVTFVVINATGAVLKKKPTVVKCLTVEPVKKGSIPVRNVVSAKVAVVDLVHHNYLRERLSEKMVPPGGQISRAGWHETCLAQNLRWSKSHPREPLHPEERPASRHLLANTVLRKAADNFPKPRRAVLPLRHRARLVVRTFLLSQAANRGCVLVRQRVKMFWKHLAA
jgi:hypothetical protein